MTSTMDLVRGDYERFLDISQMEADRFVKKYESVSNEVQMSILEKQQDFTVHFGEVWIADLGVNVGSEMDKVRPVIVVSKNPAFNRHSKLITIVPITGSKMKFPSQFEIGEYNFVPEDKNEISGIGKAEQIRAISKGRFLYKVGSLSGQGKHQLTRALKNHMGI